jgi:hypothetical protein
MKTLQITSPLMRGPDVKRAQTRLHTNPFKQDFMQGGDIDSQFGPVTGRACIRAKYWLGYATKDQRPTYGESLDAFLTGKTKLPKNQATLRASRLKRLGQKPLREKALERAAKDVGMKEKPANTNRCPITRRWGIVGPWCSMAVSVWYIDAGSKAFREHVDWAYVPYLLAAAVEGNRGVALVDANHVKRGDVVTFDWEQNGVADHVGLFDAWIDQGKTFRTIEGNTATGNDSNGGQVMRRERSVGNVARARGQLGFIHVGR